MEIARRLGLSPAERCVSDANCPDIFQLVDGRFAIIGMDATPELAASLPAGSRLGEGERIVVIDHATVAFATPDIVAATG